MQTTPMEGKIAKVSGNNVTLWVYIEEKEKKQAYEITLPTKTLHLLDIAVEYIGRTVKFKTENGKISSIDHW